MSEGVPMTDKPGGRAMGHATNLMLWTKSRRFTFISIAAVIASVVLALAAFHHSLHRGIDEAIGQALFFPLGFRGAPVQRVDHIELLLVSVAVLLAGAGLTMGIVAIRRKEPVLRSLLFATMFLWIWWMLWPSIVGWAWRMLIS
jgi:hypothetical protein